MENNFLLTRQVLWLALSLGVACAEPGADGTCRTVTSCTSDTAPICDAASLSCRTCTVGTDDVGCKNRSAATPRCGPAGRCVGCMTNADCKEVRTPVCGANLACQGCTQPSDCLSRICSADGSCTPTADVLFVSNRASCVGSGHAGTLEDPICGLPEAVSEALVRKKSFLSVEPTTLPYEPIRLASVGASGLRIVGSPSNTGELAHISGAAPAVRVTATDGKVQLLGLDLTGPGGAAVECAMGSDLTIENSRLHGSQNGVVAVGCKLSIDTSRVYDNARVGLSLTDTQYTLQNVMVWRNDVTGIALINSTGTARFATIYANGSISGNRPPGIDCGAGQNLIENSIVFDNISRLSAVLTDSQIIGCRPMSVATNDKQAGTYAQLVDFVNGSGSDAGAFDLRLKADSSNNAACCIDKAQPATAGAPLDHDIDGSRRPKGPSSDLGAHEAK